MSNEPEKFEKLEVARLTISLFEDKTIRVEGPIGDKGLSYGMLGLARDAIFEHHLRSGVKNGQDKHRIINFIRGR